MHCRAAFRRIIERISRCVPDWFSGASTRGFASSSGPRAVAAGSSPWGPGRLEIVLKIGIAKYFLFLYAFWEVTFERRLMYRDMDTERMERMESAATSAPPSSGSGWKKNIALFLGSQTLSLFGSSLVQYAMMWHLTLSTKSGVVMMIYILCGFLPAFVLSPFAGVWADRKNRKLLIIISDAFIALATLILAIVFHLGYGANWLLYVMAAVRAVGTGVQTPAVGAVLPQIVPKDALTKINGINGSLQSLNMLVAPAVSAALLSYAAIETIFLVDVVTAALAIGVLLWLVRIPAHEKAAETQEIGYFQDMKLGLAYIRQNAFLKPFFIFLGLFNGLMTPAAFLTPLQVTRSFGDAVWRLTAIELVFSIGMMAGGGIIAAWGGFTNRVHTIAFSSAIMGLCALALGVVPVFWIYLLFMGIFGVALPLLNTPSYVLLQERVDENYLGRVFGIMGMISTSTMPIGMLVFGPIADIVPIEWLLIGTGLVMVLLSSLILLNRSLVEIGKPRQESEAMK